MALPLTSTADSRIRLYVTQGRALVFSVDDIATLRTEHRVCGLLGGTLSHLAQQNVFLGPPLVLTPEETVLLVRSGAAVLVDDPNAHAHAPSEEQLQQWTEARDQEVEAQHAATAAQAKKHAEKAEKLLSPEALAKRAARQAAKARPGATAPLDLGTPLEEQTPSSPATAPAPVTPEPVHFVEIPFTSASLPWHASTIDAHVYPTLSAARDAGIWQYPSTAHERARCAVFAALHARGYWMGTGIRFGGEYLVYPGDPLRYHSHFVATVHDSRAVLRPMEIVAHGRLGTGTKKAHLFCSWDERSGEVDFYSLEWSGFG
ncbi:tRNA-intron endonuclease catalytic domain-like protein [Auriculariales sp. MPI-PUGE-AT-0066]|nr:tRNA-intron endonuclease catalytic domain-like protein [Auriculariales sp. MPI-PUGE-AT-0066]